MITNQRYFDCQMNSHKGKDNKCVHSHICQSIDPLSKTGSLDNAIQEFPLAWPLWVMNHHIISSVIHTF